MTDRDSLNRYVTHQAFKGEILEQKIFENYIRRIIGYNFELMRANPGKLSIHDNSDLNLK